MKLLPTWVLFFITTIVASSSLVAMAAEGSVLSFEKCKTVCREFSAGTLSAPTIDELPPVNWAKWNYTICSCLYFEEDGSTMLTLSLDCEICLFEESDVNRAGISIASSTKAAVEGGGAAQEPLDIATSQRRCVTPLWGLVYDSTGVATRKQSCVGYTDSSYPNITTAAVGTIGSTNTKSSPEPQYLCAETLLSSPERAERWSIQTGVYGEPEYCDTTPFDDPSICAVGYLHNCSRFHPGSVFTACDDKASLPWPILADFDRFNLDPNQNFLGECVNEPVRSDNASNNPVNKDSSTNVAWLAIVLSVGSVLVLAAVVAVAVVLHHRRAGGGRMGSQNSELPSNG